jgi:hypothetical protein
MKLEVEVFETGRLHPLKKVLFLVDTVDDNITYGGVF